MIFSSPVPFSEALAYRAAQRLLPTTVGTKELSEMAPEIRERALFSARTSNAGYLAKMDKLLTDMTSPAARAEQGLSAMDAASVRLELRDELNKLGYTPEEGKAGGLQDLGSDARLNLIIDTQLKQAYGYGQHMQAQSPVLLDLYPAQELVRVHSRKKERTDWPERFEAAGGKLVSGRMVARRDDPVWAKLSRFGTPYPPFDFMSGMGLRDVRRDEAEELGVITRRQIPKPDNRNLNDGVEVTFPKGISSALAKALRSVFTVIADKIVLEALA